MSWSLTTSWQPTSLLQFGASVRSSTCATEVETDAGRAFIKVMGNQEGPHVLATDLVGTHLARWFGLSTFDTAILRLDASDVFDLADGSTAEPGPAFATRAVAGDAWGGQADVLHGLDNPEDLTRMVVFDTWTRNCDRQDGKPNGRRPNYGNVFLMTERQPAGRPRLIAMDHGLCFIRSGASLTTSLANIDAVQDDFIYGLFPQFRGNLRQHVVAQCVDRLGEMDLATAAAMIDTVPREWLDSKDVRAAWAELVYRRAGYLVDTIASRLNGVCPWFGTNGVN